MATANSHEDIVSLGQGKVLFQGEYSFHTPGSINAPFGTFTLILSDGPSNSKLEASGEIKITTLWGTTTSTSLHLHGTGEFNGSTGYTTVNGIGKGVMIYDFNKRMPITANVNISLKPGMKSGEISVQGFGENMPCVLTSIQENSIK